MLGRPTGSALALLTLLTLLTPPWLGCARPDGGAPSDPAATTPEPPAGPAPADAGEPTAIPPPPRTSAVQHPDAAAAHAAAEAAMGSEPLAHNELVHFTPVTGGPNTPQPMRHFHEALRSLAQGKRKDKVHIAFYGASSVAADRYTGYLRRYLQHRFGDAGPGFVALVPLWRWHRHDAVRLDASKHWRIEHAQRKEGKLDGRYGLLGASAHTTNKRAKATLKAKKSASDVSAIELWYLEQPDGGSAQVEVMGQSLTLATAGSEPKAAVLPVEGMEPGRASISIRPKGDGEVRLFGATLERDDSGVVLDALGIGGTRAANMLLWDEPIWRDGLERRAPALWVLAYGANEAVDEDETIETYRANLEGVVARLSAAAPDASCLLLAPVDFMMPDLEPLEDGSLPKPEPDTPWIERTRCTEIIEVQREVAAASGCGFFDAKAMMGGNGSMHAWANADPPLAKQDHLHFTPLGYLYLGQVLADAIMADYDDPPQ